MPLRRERGGGSNSSPKIALYGKRISLGLFPVRYSECESAFDVARPAAEACFDGLSASRKHRGADASHRWPGSIVS